MQNHGFHLLTSFWPFSATTGSTELKFKLESDLGWNFCFFNYGVPLCPLVRWNHRGIEMSFVRWAVFPFQLWNNSSPHLLGVQSCNLDPNQNSDVIFVGRDFVVPLCPLDRRNHRGIEVPFVKWAVSPFQLWKPRSAWLLWAQSCNLDRNQNSDVVFVVREFAVSFYPLNRRNYRGIEVSFVKRAVSPF